MAGFEDTRLWKTTLAPRSEPDDHHKARERLRSTYEKFRERAAHVAAEIARDLPEFTVHDVTHIDALWEMADLIGGSDLNLTPTEAFVLGGAFLIHDLGMGLAAYPNGLAALRAEQIWLDTATSLLTQQLGRLPSKDELSNLPPEIEYQVKEHTLRTLHAKRAEHLAQIVWRDPNDNHDYHLIDDVELRERYGRLIGRIAHSHWWPIDRLRREFGTPLGAPGVFPSAWTIDPLLLACLLRVADASHLDERRAPGFLRALRMPSGVARHHWTFQQHLVRPRLESGRLVYTSTHCFSLEEAPSWWLCLDSLRALDKELRQVDALLADTNRSRLTARGVAGVDEPMRLTALIPTDCWYPVDTRIRATDVAGLVRKLGGEELYGRDLTVPLRELIQNAADAVRARRILEERRSDWGDVCVRLGDDDGQYWLEVEDTGIGMSADVLTGPLLDFGTSYWRSAQALEDLPGLVTKGFSPTGKYGIGFFSVFMWGDRVQITTRRFDEALQQTRVLEFGSGLSSRPILRKASESEFVRDGGCRIRVWLKQNPYLPNGVLYRPLVENPWPLDILCAWLCPSIDVNLYVQFKDQEPYKVVSASDWHTIDGEELLRRIWEPSHTESQSQQANLARKIGRNLQLVRDEKGTIVGRIAISPSVQAGRFRGGRLTILPGVVTVGGLRACSLSGIAGILVGVPQRAARDVAIPSVPEEVLAQWAAPQSTLVREVVREPESQAECASVVRACGGQTHDLAVALSNRGWLTATDIAEGRVQLPEEIFLVQDAAVMLASKRLRKVVLNDNTLAVDVGQPGILQPASHTHQVTWPIITTHTTCGGRNSRLWRFFRQTNIGAVIEALSTAWQLPLEAIVQSAEFHDDELSVVRKIAESEEGPIFEDVIIIRKPTMLDFGQQ